MKPRIKLLAVATISISMLLHQEAIASRSAACPGAEAGPGWGENVGVIATKSTDLGGDVFAKGATQCTIKFRDKHKTAPYCKLSGPEVMHIAAKVLRTSRTEATFTFNPPLTEEPFSYRCVFKD